MTDNNKLYIEMCRGAKEIQEGFWSTRKTLCDKGCSACHFELDDLNCQDGLAFYVQSRDEHIILGTGATLWDDCLDVHLYGADNDARYKKKDLSYLPSLSDLFAMLPDEWGHSNLPSKFGFRKEFRCGIDYFDREGVPEWYAAMAVAGDDRSYLILYGPTLEIATLKLVMHEVHGKRWEDGRWCY